MAKDAKLPTIEIKRTDFNTSLQEQCANEIVEHWDEHGPSSFTDLAEKYGTATASQYGKVMDRYLGPEDHDLTVEEIRARYGSVKEYLELRKADEIETDTREMSDRDLELLQEGYAQGFKDGYKEGLKDA